MTRCWSTLFDWWRRLEGPAAVLELLEGWLALVASFATSIARDKAAVRAAIPQPWSNGQTETQITKFKLVKRQMHGRAKIDLLQARRLGTA